MMGKLAQITWPQEYSELQRIEELLLCGICYEYMDTSVMTPCSHNYCSLCIRKYLHYKTQCPACFEKTFEKDLHTNRILDEIITYFNKIREKLASCITGAKIVAANEDANNEDLTKSTPVRPARTNQSLKKVSPKIELERVQVIDNSPKVEKVQTFVPEQQQIVYSPSTSGVTKIATIFTPKSKKNLTNVATSGKSVPCPVCAVEVSEVHINRHLDECLKRETATQKVTKIEPKRKPLPKLVFSLMKDAELRKRMKDLGLPSQGDRKTLEARFHRYSTLYNAECDKKEPRAIEELLKQCENEENLEKKMLKFSQASNRLKITRNCEQNMIEEAQKKYLETNRQNYSELIASIKERDNKKRSVRRSLISNQEVQRQETGLEVQPVKNNENLETSTEIEDDPLYYSIHAYEATFHDSDSESSCPLQHYTSDDPVNFLSFEMTVPEGSPEEKAITNQSSSQNSKEKENKSPEYSSAEKKEESTKEVLRMADIYCATTDNETSDEDYIPPSPNATISRTTKRAKFSLQTDNKGTNNCNKSNDQEKDILAGHKLAMSIAQDFTFDSSSDDGLPSQNVNETETKILKESLTKNGDIEKEEKSKIDKENHESSTETSCEKMVNRPLRKRKCLRFPNVGNVEKPRLNEKKPIDKTKTTTTTSLSQEESEKVNEEEESLSRPSRVDSPLKRRRRRKVTPKETETVDPPRRPLRKRLVNSKTAGNTKK